MLITLFETTGRLFLSFLRSIGAVTLFSANTIVRGFSIPFYWKQVLVQIVQIGYFSIPVVGLTAIFTGMAMALQCYSGFAQYAAESTIPTVVMVAMLRELGPVLTAIMVAGRLGASMTAEIGTMKVTEQIDALTTLAVDPLKYLVFPRVLIGTLFVPFLVLIDDIIGILGGYLVCVFSFGFNSSNYIYQTFSSMSSWDVISGLIKGGCFGFMICLLGCYCGFASKRGAEGVGVATTNSVVSASIMILFLNSILTFLMF